MKPLIQLKNISFSIGEKKIIDNINLSIFSGDFVVILGGNGSGKSTLLKLINQTYPCTSGEILLNDQPIKQYPKKILQKKIVTLTQFIAKSIFTDLTVEENAILIESAFCEKDFDKKNMLTTLPDYLSKFNIKLAQALKIKVSRLSGGEQQILAFALYLRHQPDLLLLDEHTSALDPKKANDVMALTQQFIQKNHITCLMTTHSLPYAVRYGNKLIALQDGAIVFTANEAEKEKLTAEELLKHCY